MSNSGSGRAQYSSGVNFGHGDLSDYPCPECGYDGPHSILNRREQSPVVECGDTACGAEFTADPGNGDPVPVQRDGEP